MQRPLLLGALLSFAMACVSHAAAPALVLKDNDVWVMAGDSITAQRLHTNYIEAFYRTRHPDLHLHFRNSGIGGNRTKDLLARFEYDVAAWKPTIVSIELGMNDVNGTGESASVETYIANMKELIAKIRAIHAQPVLISSSPVDDGSKMGDWKSPRCERLHPFTEALQKLAQEENIVFADQYHALLDIWGENRRKGAEEAAKHPAPPPAPEAAPDPSKPVPAKPAPPKLPPSLIPLGGDAVHTGPVGQASMAVAILQGLGAGGERSSVSLAADGQVKEAKGCTISEVTAADGVLRFNRLDVAGPWPLPAATHPISKLLPDRLALKSYYLDITSSRLSVTGLPEGPSYKVALDGNPSATAPANGLAVGLRVTTPPERVNAITALISKLQGPLNNAWRKASKEKDAAALATAQTEIEACEKELQALVQPVPVKVEILK